jgi:hypothetical protein
MEKEDLIRYWVDSSDRDYKAMHHLYVIQKNGLTKLKDFENGSKSSFQNS